MFHIYKSDFTKCVQIGICYYHSFVRHKGLKYNKLKATTNLRFLIQGISEEINGLGLPFMFIPQFIFSMPKNLQVGYQNLKIVA